MKKIYLIFLISINVFASNIEQLKKECNNNYMSNACSELTYAYEFGKGVKKNINKAKKIKIQQFQSAKKDCLSKNTIGCINLGSFYQKGRGTKQNFYKAKKLFEFGCNDHYSEACIYLGYIYQNGEGINKNNEKANQLFLKAFRINKENCEKNKLESCYDVGINYLTGDIIQQNTQQALKYFGKACSGGYTNACRDYDRFKRGIE